ncbi:O-methyltransferase [Fodinicola acaciae]|uniref:O-methyltransferase n=1 Tax=Fodinicola acaciae TaxID=2681555 RepID=UPI0013D85939|nr:class I SAM-dependent methyltransferase [Fodinicola acaciae]
MDEKRLRQLESLYEEGRQHDEKQPDRLKRRRNVDPGAAAFLVTLIRAIPAPRVLEIGTSNGYSTIWLADACAAVGGQVTTVDTETQAGARDNLEKAGLAEHVTFVAGDGGEFLRGLAENSVDLLFLDAERTEYPGWWPHPLRVIRPGGILVADNALSHPAEIAPLQELLENEPSCYSTLVPVGSGELVAVLDR